MIPEITASLKAKLDTLKGSGKPLCSVIDYLTEKADGFPFACFELAGFEGEILDSCNDLRTFNYVVAVFQDLPDAGNRGEAMETLVKAVEAIVNAFDSDYTLGGTVKMVRPSGATI